MKIKPMRDRVLVGKFHKPGKRSSLLDRFGEPIPNGSGVAGTVLAIGPEVKDLEEGDVVLIADRNFHNAMRSFTWENDRVKFFHEQDLDGVIEDDSGAIPS